MCEYAKDPMASHMPTNECIADYLNQRIDSTVTDYMGSLTTGDYVKLEQVPESERTEEVCRQLAANPVTFPKAVNLQSLRVMRRLHNTGAAGVHGPEGSVQIPPLNDYWVGVDKTIYNHLKRFTQRESGLTIPAHAELPADEPVTICNIGSYAVLRTALPSRYMIEYSTSPADQA